MGQLPVKFGNYARPFFRVFATLFVSMSLLTPIYTFTPTIAKVEATPDTLKVIEVRYFPQGEANVPYHPDDLSLQLQGSIETASTFHGYIFGSTETPSIDVEVVDVYDRFSARPNPNGSWYSTYEAILNDGDLCSVINTQNIDQVWLWVDPRVGYDPGPGVEYAISSNYFGGDSQYAEVANPAFCGGSRSFLFMGFDYTRTADNALHSFGHMMEGVLGNLQTVELFWYRYGGNTAAGFPLTQRCGNVHFPPNGTADYDYNNLTVVTSSCPNWTPNGGTSRSFDCREWGCNQMGYLKWWMQNMPNEGNTLTYQGRKLPNWWDFVQNLDQNIPAYANDEQYFMNRSFLKMYECNVAVTKPTSASSVSHTANGCGANDKLVAVTVSYRAVLNHTNHRISTMQYNGNNMTKACAANSNEYTTEIWYYQASSLPGGTITVDWSMGAAQDIVIASKTFSDVYQPNPIGAKVCTSDNGQWSSNPTIGKNPTAQLNPATAVAFGAATTFSGNFNKLSADSDIQRWNVSTTNVISSGITSDNQASLNWTGTVNWPWSVAAITVRKSNYVPVNITNVSPVFVQSAPLNNTLNWSASTISENNPLGFDVYLGTDSANLNIVSTNQSGLAYAATGLQKGTTYFWRVAARDPFGGYTLGPISQFKTYDDVAVVNNIAKNKPVTGVGITGTAGAITDGYKFTEGTDETTQPSVYLNSDNTSYLQVDLGASYSFSSVTVQVSNNDSYRIEVSTNGTTWVTYTTLTAETNSDGKFKTKQSPLSTTTARYLRIKSISGARTKSISEIQVN